MKKCDYPELDAQHHDVWTTLRCYHIIKEHGEDIVMFRVVCQYMSSLSLDYILYGRWDYENKPMFKADYQQAASDEITDRALLGKKKLELPT